jgi:hypothetical protein
MSETDAFAAVTNLIALVADPKAAGQRMTALEKQLEAVARAQERLAADRQQHDRARAELEVRELRLRERESAVTAREGRQAPSRADSPRRPDRGRRDSHAAGGRPRGRPM